jgi:acyl-CoA thioester hydrolase
MPASGVSHPPPLPAPLYQGSANTWECDDGGHLNIRFHVERAFSGLAHLALKLEMPRAFTPSAGSTLVPLDLHMRFLREARAGAPLIMHGGVLDLGADQMLACLDMRHADGAPASVFSVRAAHADTRDFRAFPWSLRSRAAAQRLACAAPAHAKARSLAGVAAPTQLSLARAAAHGAQRIGAALVTPEQCDAFGRLRGEQLMGQVSDAVPNFLADWRASLGAEAAARGVSADPAGAVVEARLSLRAWPRAGDLIEVHSAIVAVADKTLRLCHWIVDPESGVGWARLDVIALTFDTQTRKTMIPSPALRVALQARAIATMAD